MESEEVLRNPGVQKLPKDIVTSQTEFSVDSDNTPFTSPTAEYPGGAQEVAVAPWAPTPYPTTG